MAYLNPNILTFISNVNEHSKDMSESVTLDQRGKIQLKLSIGNPLKIRNKNQLEDDTPRKQQHKTAKVTTLNQTNRL